MPSHPTTEQLRAFALGQLRPGEASLVERHVETCDQCCTVLNAVPDDAVLKFLKQGDAPGGEADRGQPEESDTSGGRIPPALRDHSRYRIIKLLGDGGMGVVYKAEHRLMARMVALKVISRRLLSNPLAVERFRREFKAAARLAHPNIVVAHDADEAGGLHFLVMEFVDGLSLAQYVERKGPLPVATACFFIRQAALGLQHAARQGMVHRDIKPQNLMLTRKGQIKILDFGLARFASEGAALSGLQPVLSGHVADFALTQAGMIVGTPDYMAPEQAIDSSQADIRSDIYSLGCTFFFLLTGQPPFSGNSIASTLNSHAEQQPPELETLRNDLPPELIRIIEQMMAKNSAARIQTPGEVAQRLAKFATGGLAAASSLDLPQPKLLTSRPAPTVLDEAAERQGPVSTMQLVLRGRWRTIRHRLQHDITRLSRVPPSQITAVVVLVLLLGVGVSWIANRRPVDGRGQINNTPRQVNNPPRQIDEVKAPAAVPAVDIAVKKRPPRVALVLTRESFWSPDYVYLRDAFERQGIAVTVVSSRVGLVTSDPRLQEDKNMLEVQADVAFRDIRPGDFDAVVFIPSSNSEFMHDSNATPDDNLAAQEAYAKLLRDLTESNVCLAGLGNSVSLLARYGILDGQQATGPDWVAEQPEYQAVKWDTTHGAVASGPDGQFVTAWNIRSVQEFAEKVAASCLIRSRGQK